MSIPSRPLRTCPDTAAGCWFLACRIIFPWYHVFREEIQINTSVGPECGEFFQTAADMVLDDRASALTEMVMPRMPWDKAPEAFEMYAERARGSLKLTLEV